MSPAATILPGHRASDATIAHVNRQLVTEIWRDAEKIAAAERGVSTMERVAERTALRLVGELRAAGFAVRVTDAGAGWGAARYDIVRG